LVANLVANRQDRMCGICVSGRVRLKAGTAFERKSEGSFRRNRAVGVLDAYCGSNRAPIRLRGDGETGKKNVASRQIGHVPLPPGVHDGVAKAHQEPVTRVGGSYRIVDPRAGRNIIEITQGLLVAAVVDPVEELVITP